MDLRSPNIESNEQLCGASLEPASAGKVPKSKGWFESMAERLLSFSGGRPQLEVVTCMGLQNVSSEQMSEDILLQ